MEGGYGNVPLLCVTGWYGEEGGEVISDSLQAMPGRVRGHRDGLAER